MKKCPYCRKEVPDDATECSHCHCSLVFKTPEQKKKDPPDLLILVSLVLLFAVFFGIFFGTAYLLAILGPVDRSVLNVARVLLMILFGGVLSYFGVPGLDPKKRKPIHYVLVFFVMFVPFVSWLAIYWAAKGIALMLRKKPASQPGGIPATPSDPPDEG